MSAPSQETEPVTLQTLHTAVLNLTKAVAALDITLKNDYPTRIDVRKRRWQLAAAMAAAIVASYFCTVGTISYCFLDGIPAENAKSFCQIFPGWDESFNNNRVAQHTFEDLIKKTDENSARLDKLEGK